MWSLGECSLCVNGPLPCMYAFTPGHTQVTWSVVWMSPCPGCMPSLRVACRVRWSVVWMATALYVCLYSGSHTGYMVCSVNAPLPCMYAFTPGHTRYIVCSVNAPLRCMYAFTPGHTPSLLFQNPSSRVCHNWLHHLRGTSCLPASVRWTSPFRLLLSSPSVKFAES